MNHLRKITALLLALIMVLALAGCSGSSASPSAAPTAAAAGPSDGKAPPTYVLKVADVASEDNPYNVGLRYFADLVSEQTNGDVQIDVYPNSSLGGEREILEGLQLGTIDMCLVSTAPVANFSQSMYVFDLPYLFTDLETTYEVLDGEIGDELAADLVKDGFHTLAYWQNGFFNIITKEQVIHPQDLSGMTIRAFENPIHQAYFSQCGANPVPAPWGEVYTMLQNGTVDGCTTSYTFIYNTQLDEVAKYVANTHQVYAVAPMFISTITWDSLPENYQKIISDCAVQARDYERDECNSKEDTQKKELTDKGMVLSDVDRDEWAEFMKPVWSDFVGEGKYISQDLVDRIQAITSKGTR